jgi:hypothetical protein
MLQYKVLILPHQQSAAQTTIAKNPDFELHQAFRKLWSELNLWELAAEIIKPQLMLRLSGWVKVGFITVLTLPQ